MRMIRRMIAELKCRYWLFKHRKWNNPRKKENAYRKYREQIWRGLDG